MIQENKKEIAALYIRVSTDAQAEEGYSIEAQSEMLEAYCKTKGFTDYSFYIDGGFSGSNIARPEMQKLIDDVKAGKVHTVIVYKLDRLSRSQKDTLYLIEDVFNLHGTQFASINENFDTSTPIGRAMLGIISAFAQLEREQIRERTRMGMQERVKKGYWPGGGKTPFGYDYDKELGTLVKNQDALKVEQIYDLYLQGFSLQKIADIIGLKYDRLAQQILLRKSNTGVIVYNGIEYQGRHEPIVSLEKYNEAMEQFAKRSINYTYDNAHYLQGLVYCGKCGAKMHYQSWGKKGKKLVCYSQQSNKKYLIKDPNCDNLKLWADDIEETVINDLLNMNWNLILESKDREKISISTLELLEHQDKVLSDKLKRLYDLYGSNGNAELLEIIQKTRNDKDRVGIQIATEKENSTISSQIIKTEEMLKNIKDVWSVMDFKERQNTIRNIIDKVIVTDNKVSVKYKFFTGE